VVEVRSVSKNVRPAVSRPLTSVGEIDITKSLSPFARRTVLASSLLGGW
jgi:hypothetical protein